MAWVARLALLAFLGASCGPMDGSRDAVTTGSLYSEMIDLAGLAEFPNPAYKTMQFSSYDRRSSVPGGPDWFANSDGFGGEPRPGFEAVLREPGEDSIGQYLVADVAGPGAIVPLWTAAIDGRNARARVRLHWGSRRSRAAGNRHRLRLGAGDEVRCHRLGPFSTRDRET